MRKSNADASLKRKPQPPCQVLESLHGLLRPAVDLMDPLRGICGRSSALSSLLHPGLERQHGRLLVRLEMHVLLDTVDVLDGLLNDVAGVAFPGRTLSCACMAEE